MGDKQPTSLLRSHWIYFGIALILTVTLYTLYGVNMVRWRNSPDFGWRTNYSYGPNVVAEVFAAGEAAGIRVGDTIKAVNGQTYSTFDELFFKIRNEQPGSLNTYTVVRNGKDLDITITTGRQGLLVVLWRSGSFCLVGFVYLMIGVLVFLMKPRARESWLFLSMTLFLGMTVSYSSPTDLMRPLWLYDVRRLFDVLLPASVLQMGLRFPKTRTFLRKRPWLSIVPYAVSFALFAVIKITSPAYWSTPPVLELIILVYWMLAVLVFIVSTVWNFLKDRSVMIRLQSQAIFVGLMLGFFIPVIEQLVRSLWNVYIFADPTLGFMVFLTLFPLSIGYTIVRHDLFAIDAIIKRTYGYVLTTGAIAGIYGLVVLVSNLAFGRYEITKSPIFPLAFILAVVFFFNPVRNRVQRFIDRVFYRLEYDYQETVGKISETMRSLLNLDEIGKNIINFALQPMFVDAGAVMLLNPDKKTYDCLIHAGQREEKKSGAGAETAAPEEIDEEKEDLVSAEAGEGFLGVSELKLPADDPLIQKIAERKKEVTIYDIERDPFFEADRKSCEQAIEQLGATLIVPLIYEDRLTGLISLGRKKSGKFYRREDINLLNTLANQGAVAIENARMVDEVIEKERMEEELNIARDLQVSMLPAECPQIKGFEIAAFSVSAREVGGDFYDFIDMGEEKAGFVIGDVTGKSVSGALVMSASRSVFRMLSEAELSVGESMMRANRRLKKDVKTGMFVALLYTVLNAQDQTLTLCSAGQTQPVHLSAKSGTASLVETKGDTFPLGILDDAKYEETRLQLETGDKVVFYTDGIVEAMNAQEEMFGFERLLEVVQKSRSSAATDILNEIIESVKDFTGSAPQHDDLTAIVVSVRN
jgi:sigma-B regulation protein RsbU (phosphoserine phosphatase)